MEKNRDNGMQTRTTQGTMGIYIPMIGKRSEFILGIILGTILHYQRDPYVHP